MVNATLHDRDFTSLRHVNTIFNAFLYCMATETWLYIVSLVCVQNLVDSNNRYVTEVICPLISEIYNYNLFNP